MVLGTVLRSHAGGYVVHQDEVGIEFLCTARGRLKKENVSILAGDRVELDEINFEQATAVVVAVLERSNVLTRPPLANVDQVVIVQAIHQPEWNCLWCDRHLVHFQLEVPSASFVLCLNKSDLAVPGELAALRSIYEPLGYSVMIVSAKTGDGLPGLSAVLAGKISVLAGPSGVGKSSLINALNPQVNLKVGLMENEFGVGRHTTTASEVYRLKSQDKNPTWVADTPGFGVSELRHPEPSAIAALFRELGQLASECRYSDCLHVVEQDCNVRTNINKISPERYQSYSTLVAEAQAEQKLRQESSSKVEGKVKLVGGKQGRAKQIPRLNERYRTPSRRTEKQQLIATKLEGKEEGDEHFTDEE